jgi:toxin ParE1/3/4
MTTHRVTIRAEAERDLADIYDFIAEKNPDAALKFVSGLWELALSLGTFPRRGVPRDDLMPGIRCLSFRGRATIAYRIVRGVVEVTRVFYRGRDYQAILRSLRSRGKTE